MNAGQRALALGGLLALFGCTDFPVIEQNVCGNAIKERDVGEDCDTFAPSGNKCRPPGAINACHYDCSLNAEGTRTECPIGYGCSADSVCRAPNAKFDPPAKFSSEPSSWLSTTDFDGDHRLDVISAGATDKYGQARFELHYFDEDAQLVQSKTFPRLVTRPIARQITGKDAAMDLLFSNFRVGLLAGRADRQWVPATFSSYVLANSGLRIVGVSNDFVGDASALVAITAVNGVNALYTPDFLDGGLRPRAKLPGPVADLSGAIAADLIEGAESPCTELVLAYRGAHQFRVYDMCTPGGEQMLTTSVIWRDAPLEQVVDLPEGLVVDAGPIAADVDGDGHLDVLIGAGGHPYLARGDGKGLEGRASSFERDEYVNADMQVRRQRLASLELEMPIAAGDYSGDGVADFVESGRLVTSRRLDSGTAYVQSYSNRRELWTTAEIADLNGNGLPDVIAASVGSPGLTFLSGTGGPYQISTTIDTQGPVQQLTVGDFDGDLVRDIAVIQDGSSGASDSLALAYGNRDAPPSPATRMAEVAGVTQLGDFEELGLGTLFLTTRRRTERVDYSTLTLFDAGSERLPFAPYSLVNFSTDGALQDSQAAGILAGSFVAPGSNDVVALGAPHLNETWGFWLLADIGRGLQPPRLLKGLLPKGVVPVNSAAADGRERVSLAGVAADVDRDGIDEALWLMSRADAGCALIIDGIDTDARAVVEKERIDFDEPCPSPELSVADLDHDGGLDLLLLIGDPGLAPRQLRLLWNQGEGSFSSDDYSLVSDLQQGDVRAFSVFSTPPTPRTPRTRIAFVSDNGLFIANRSQRKFDDVTFVHEFDDARSVVVTDPNSDQIEDVVVADSAGLWLLEAQLR